MKILGGKEIDKELQKKLIEFFFLNLNNRFRCLLLPFFAKLDIELLGIGGGVFGRRFLKYERSKKLANNRMRKEASGPDIHLTDIQNNIVIEVT